MVLGTDGFGDGERMVVSVWQWWWEKKKISTAAYSRDNAWNLVYRHDDCDGIPIRIV